MSSSNLSRRESVEGKNIFSPVRALSVKDLKSPKTPSSIIKPRLSILVNKIVEYFDVWSLGHDKGIKICRNIETIKTKLLEKSDGLISDELENAHKRLEVAKSVLEDVIKQSKEIQSQLGSLEKLQQNPNEIIFRTWTIGTFVEVHNELLQRYKSEFEVKSKVCQEIGFCINQSQLIVCTSMWSYPQFVNKSADFIIKCIKTECE